MKNVAVASIVALTCLPAIVVGGVAHAQSATATGTGTGIAISRSNSAATAIGGGNATGGNAAGGAGGAASVNFNSNVPANQTINSVASGTQTIRNVPTEFAPGLTAAGLETCLGSVSGGGAFVGTGFSFGSTIPDPGCAARLDARTLWSFGLKKAAVARLCLMTDVYNSMPDVCNIYLPPRPGYAVASAALPGTPPLEPEYVGGPVEVTVHGRPGVCDDYDMARHRCRVRIHYQ